MPGIEGLIRFEPDGNHVVRDISAVLQDAEAFREVAEYMYQMFEREVFDKVVCIDNTGSVFATAVACRMGKGLVEIRQNRIAGDCSKCTVESHHGSRTFRMAPGAVSPGERVVIIGDVLTYGKDVAAAAEMVEKAGGKVVKIGMFVEDSDFKARRKVLRAYPLESMIITADL